MWISRQVKKTGEEPAVQTGCVTGNDNGALEAVTSGVEREITLYAPYGYSYSLPAGERLLLAGCDGAQAGVGVAVKERVNKGEIKIATPFGSYIYLKKDGSVVINGLTIDKNGEVVSRA